VGAWQQRERERADPPVSAEGDEHGSSDPNNNVTQSLVNSTADRVSGLASRHHWRSIKNLSQCCGSNLISGDAPGVAA
jgi:hypothetical protein